MGLLLQPLIPSSASSASSPNSILSTPTTSHQSFLFSFRSCHHNPLQHHKWVFRRSYSSSLRPCRLRHRHISSSLHMEGVPQSSSTFISDKHPDEVSKTALAGSGGGDALPPLPPFPVSPLILADSLTSAVDSEAQRRRAENLIRRKAERSTYLFAAVASTAGITFLTVGAIYYRFSWQTQGMEVPFSEMFGTFSLAFGASVGMEYWARWAHRALWHNSLWSMHESHHRPRDGPFELNDVFAIINAVPAIALIAYGFFHTGLVPGLCFGAGLGITMFGIAYMFVHDGLVHRRFPVGPIADVPYFQKVAAAHQLHHADKFEGVPYGLFLGPKELEAEDGGAEELEKMMQLRMKSLTSST